MHLRGSGVIPKGGVVGLLVEIVYRSEFAGIVKDALAMFASDP